MKVKWKIIIIILVIVLAIAGCNLPATQPTENKNEIVENIVEVVQQENIDTNITIENQIEEQVEYAINIPTPVIKYTTTGVNLREKPSLDSKIIRVLPINTKINVIESESEWLEVKENENTYYIYAKYVSNEKTKIEPSKVTSRSGDSVRKNTTTTKGKVSSNPLTKSKGVVYFNGHKETWYSQKVLPGGGLKIPGRHVDGRGLVCDGDGYICVASSDYKKGTIVETSLGTGKVYDSGCAKNTIDIYVDW